MRKLVLTLGVTLLLGSTALAEEQKARILVGGLYCPSCSYIAGEALKMAETVVITEAVVAEDGTMAVYFITFDDAETNAEEVAEMTMLYGYPSQVLPLEDTDS